MEKMAGCTFKKKKKKKKGKRNEFTCVKNIHVKTDTLSYGKQKAGGVVLDTGMFSLVRNESFSYMSLHQALQKVLRFS